MILAMSSASQFLLPHLIVHTFSPVAVLNIPITCPLRQLPILLSIFDGSVDVRVYIPFFLMMFAGAPTALPGHQRPLLLRRNCQWRQHQIYILGGPLRIQRNTAPDWKKAEANEGYGRGGRPVS